MMYLIGQLSIWLLLAAGFAAFAGWTFAAQRAAPARRKLRAARERLVRDLAQLAAGEGGAPDMAIDTSESLTRIREGRIAELERALETARARADDAAGEVAQLRRQLEHGGDSGELSRLRSLVAEHEQQRAQEIEAEVVEPAADEESMLQAWRLRYFEQRVRYLESLGQAPLQLTAPPAEPAPPASPEMEWRAREAEARAAHLEQELRALSSPPTQEAAPFAADANIDALLRWRLLYLERRVGRLQQRSATPALDAPAAVDAGPDPDRWKWRARYLEARVRHLEQRPAVPAQPAAGMAAPERAAPEPAAARPARRGVKPAVLASARNGAPDDLTLIDGVSLQQQSTFYSLGVFHFDQIAAWTPDEAAWVDQYLRLGGRIEDEEWIEQAGELARDGPMGPRRALESETA